jgi:hypothetical protein
MLMGSPSNSELEHVVDTLRAITEDDVTEPLLPAMRTLVGKLDRRCSEAYAPRVTASGQMGGRHPERIMWNAS